MEKRRVQAYLEEPYRRALQKLRQERKLTCQEACRVAIRQGLRQANEQKERKERIMQNTERLTMTVREMAEALRISYNTALRLTKQEGFPKVMIGKRAVIPIDSLKGWLKKEAE